MKKRVIALSVAAALGGFAATASAQVVPPAAADYLTFNSDGVGHILLVPYFSTQGGNATLLNIVNTDTVNGKAVKVRFRGASNSDDIFDFQVFLSPGDVWAANISQGTSGLSHMNAAEPGGAGGSCTLPSNINQDFITARLNPDLTGEDLANETREGYIEILNMADIPSVSGTTSVWYAIKHNSAGSAPCTASILEGLQNNDSRLALPTTGLMANWTIINVPQTTTWTGEAAAIQANTLATGLAGTGNNVYHRQASQAVLDAGLDILELSADPLFRGGFIEPALFDLPDLSTPYVNSLTPQAQANALSNSMATQVAAAEYLSDPSIAAATDWVITKPTRRYYVAVDYAATSPVDKLVTNYDDNLDTSAVYYRSKLSDGSAAGNTVMGTGASGNGGKTYQACTQVTSVQFWNRQEVSPSSNDIVISPGTPAPAPSLCGEVSVLGINSASNSPVKSGVARFNLALPAGLVDGWGKLTTTNELSGTNLGLPLLLNQFVKAVNSSVSAGVSGTFGAQWSGRVVTPGDLRPVSLPISLP